MVMVEMEALDHLCRHCETGRLMRRNKAGGGTEVWCSNCNKTAHAYDDLCWCGFKYAGAKHGAYRCVKSPAPTPENPHAVLVELNQDAFRIQREVKPKAKAKSSSERELF